MASTVQSDGGIYSTVYRIQELSDDHIYSLQDLSDDGIYSLQDTGAV
jgi:hypothetical protein